jgi:hypothetical protein
MATLNLKRMGYEQRENPIARKNMKRAIQLQKDVIGITKCTLFYYFIQFSSFCAAFLQFAPWFAS